MIYTMIKLKNILNESNDSQIINSISRIAKSHGFKEETNHYKWADKQDGIIPLKTFVSQDNPKWPWIVNVYKDERLNQLWCAVYVAHGGGEYWNDPAKYWANPKTWDKLDGEEDD